MAARFLQRSRHGTTYFFRRRVPEDIQQAVRLKQLFRSLATTDPRKAIIRARSMAALTDRVFAEIRVAKKLKKNEGELRADYSFDISMNELGLPLASYKSDPNDTPEESERGLAEFRALASGLLQEAHERSAAMGPAGSALKPGKPLSEAIEEYLAEGWLKDKTKRTYGTALRIEAINFFGADTLISEIDQDWFARYVKHIFADTKRAHATKEGFIHAFTSMYTWLHGRYRKSTTTLSTKTLIPQNQITEAEQRDEFTLGQLHILFTNARRYLRTEPHKFWVTVAVAFLGCRVEELAQIDLSIDLKQDPESQVWYLDFNQAPDADGVKRKSLKNMPSKRVAPLHSALIEHGFLKYLQEQLSDGFARPFERGWKPLLPKKGGVHWAHSISKWGGHELSALAETGILSRDGLSLAYFHSMRHTFTNVLVKRNVGHERRVTDRPIGATL